MPTPKEILQQYWGYSSFRPLQEPIIEAALNGQDALALLPTGGGKSICYQVPALCLQGMCLVVSPLIALMKDQVHNLQKRQIPAAAIHAGMNSRAIDITLENACQGAYKLLYVSPERLATDMFLARVNRMPINLLAVDEAHCISQWGYDFRPAYLKIADLRAWLPDTPVLALTATATEQVVTDIQEKLKFRAKTVFRQGFERANLSYSVLYESKKREKLLDILRNVPGTGIVYTRSRGETREISEFLRENRISADFYHAGLAPDQRNAKQDAWLNGQTQVIVSTNAFGMGIDKPNVRVVVHMALPDSLEAYFQEAGRAGRDGQKSYAVLLYAPTDADRLEAHLASAFPTPEQIKKTYRSLISYTQMAQGAGAGESFDFDFAHFCHTYQLEQGPAHAALKLLEQEEWIFLSDAFAGPAQVQIIASREVLYDYQLRNKQADTLTKVLLRAYPGIHSELTSVSESLIAQYAKMPIEQVIQTLQAAHQANIVLYEPRKDKPQLVFTKPVAAPDDLNLDLAKLNFRKEQAAFRVKHAIRYAETLRCRSVQLLAYFGEPESRPCGICDVCTGRNKTEVRADEFALYENKIRMALRHESLPFDELIKAFAPKKQAIAAGVIAYLLDEGKLNEDEAGRLYFR